MITAAAPPEVIPPRQWSTFGQFWRGGWRSTASWIGVLMLILHGLVAPSFDLAAGRPVRVDWPELLVILGGLGVLAHYRSRDLTNRTTT